MGAWVWWVSLWVAVGARELDPEACAARFDVQRDKIIRTEESRGMGARYLSELEVGARHECLHLCCETDACDVFVFEEKSPGSCYLFNCGPPEDFRCKFTAHGNFTSGVLALSRRLAELQDQERLVHHERELASLRSRPSTPSTPATTPPVRSTQAPTPQRPPDARRPPHDLPPPGRCSRYQFECRRGGECIAVYNACDGVPQCADGSDEAPELGCPATPPAPTRAPPPPPATATPALPPPPPPPVLTPQLQMGIDESTDEGADLWPHRLTQAQPPRRYNTVSAGSVSGSHIFSHKGGLVQDNAFEAPSANAPWPHRTWQSPHAPPVSDGMDMDRGWGAYGRLGWPEVEPHRSWPVPQPRPEQEMPVYMPSKEMPELPLVYASQQQTLRDSAKKGFELVGKGQLLRYGTEAPAPAPQPPPPPPPPAQPDGPHSDATEGRQQMQIQNATKKKVLKDNIMETKKVSQSAEGAGGVGGAERPAPLLPAHAHFSADEHDGLSEHPPSAVLLLVLGTLMTTSLGAMLVCRMRRRYRRGGPRLALDSDYLVNGMYL